MIINTLKSEMIKMIRDAKLKSNSVSVKNIYECSDENPPTSNQCPIIWIDAEPSGLSERITHDTNRATIRMTIWCWVSAKNPGKDGREKSLDLLHAVQKLLVENTDYGSSCGVMPRGWSWGAYTFYEGIDICGVSAIVDFVAYVGENSI